MMIINKKILINFIVLITALSFISCEDFLKEDAGTLVPGDEFHTSLGDAFAIKAGLYSTFQELTEQMYIWGEVRGDLLAEATGLKSNRDLHDIHTFNFESNNRYLNTRVYYKMIQQCNEALAHFAEMGKVVPELIADGGDMLHQLQSEALTIRAKCYFDLIRTFGDANFVLAPVESIQDMLEYDSPVYGKDAILNHLEKDLKWSADYIFLSLDRNKGSTVKGNGIRTDDCINGSHLKEARSNISDELAPIMAGEVMLAVYRWDQALGKDWNRTTVSMAYTRALLGDIYMYREKYEQAIEQYQIIEKNGNNNDVQLMRVASDFEWFNFLEATGSSDPRSAGSATSGSSTGNAGISGNPQRWFQRIFASNSASYKVDCELVFYVRYDQNLGQTNFYEDYFLPSVFGGKYYFQPAENTLNIWNDDGRGDNLSYRLDTISGAVYPSVFKFITNTSGADYRISDNGQFDSDISYFTKRIADCFLKQAEAYNILGESEAATIILNARIRANRLGEEDAPIISTTTFEEVDDIIFEERQRELAYEGERWYDLMRYAKRRGNDYLANRVASRISDVNESERVRNLLMDQSNWYLPTYTGGGNIIPINFN